MINTIKYSILLLFVLASFTACQNDDATSANIDAMVAEPGDLLNQAFPNNKVRVEGEGLTGLKKITLDNTINIAFNPNYNSDKSFIFTIPFDEKLGSRFGVQPITFTTANGSVTKNIEILQPVPTITKTTPAVATPGFPLEIEGTWFYNISSITLAGKEVSYTVKSSSSIIIGLPANAASGSELAITTPGGTAKKTIDFATIILVSDFDGNGARKDWTSYGDVESFNTSTAGGPTGNYTTLVWAGSTANGYNGSSGGGGASFLSASNTDAAKAYIDIDVSANVMGAQFAIQLNTIDGVNYGYNFKITDVNWTTKTISIADFKDNYGFGSNTAANLNPSKINEIKVGIAQGDTPNPSAIKFDNIKIRYQ
ncbi:Cell surface receptor IPT/TIG domain protein [Flavobacterium anhuiense]|uniref:Cell surface receptor IPT/TIG domain protein n=1 Tax=Flavobacterium anhuiense TaxID=459526 RepID=A0A444VSH2_9FLAO|nr:CIA30 family protein [Flavobacterium anhuiense]RYJ36416.1 Cell surface receptor IPT/TIG domain protein [Flavobacterium anhuiense]